MSTKGDKTKQIICDEAYKLFSKRGYKDITMKDICEQTGLSRARLFRHYKSVEQIFLEIVNDFSTEQKDKVSAKIVDHIPASTILSEILSRYANEMIDSENSLSQAIYEFYSNPEISKTKNSVITQYGILKSTWIDLINYGMVTKEFKKVNPEGVFDIIIFSYQGVRMYSKLMKIDESIPNKIINEIKRLLLPEEV